MTVDYKYKKGIDLPVWQWLAFSPAVSYHGTSNIYDGVRYQYWAIQSGSTSTTASTTQLFRYDTWSNSWQYMANLTSANQGIDMEYDSTRNLLYIIHGGLTSWQVFNLNTTAVTVVNQSCAAWALTTITTVLPAVAGPGASLSMPSDDVVPATIDVGTAAATGNTTTVVKATDATGTFGQGMLGLQVRVTSGAQNGAIRTITSVTDKNTLTVSSALAGALASGDTFVIEQVTGTTTAGATTTTLPDTSKAWTVNAYSNHDVIMTSGALAGQRRRIASNTATVLTLAAAVTGNTNTGAFTGTPATGDTYKIVPSRDILYYQPGSTSATLYKIDVAQTTGTAWATLAAPSSFGGGGNTFFPSAYGPYTLVGFRGGATVGLQIYNIGLNTWTTITTYAASETISTGAASAMVTGKRKLILTKEGSTRVYALDLLTGILEPCGTVPYAAPSTYEGKRARVVTTADGAQFLYVLRSGGQEFFRVPLEWIT